MEKLNEFYNAGLINPDWTSYALPADFTASTYNNEIAYQYHGATGLADAKKSSVDPDCNWQPTQKPLLYEGQILHVGSSKSRVGTGNCSFAAKNNNLELAMKWIDYRYSPEGWELYCYGPEGVVCYIDENGERRNTEWALNHPDGFELTWLVFLYSLDAFVDPGIVATETKLLNDSGEIANKTISYWTDWLSTNYDASGVFPIGARLSIEQSETISRYQTDIITYISENFSGFLDGSKSFDDWDEYVETLNIMGLQAITDTYQDAYEEYLERIA
jgi:putative aldouronate transport system substrate-binding protein